MKLYEISEEIKKVDEILDTLEAFEDEENKDKREVIIKDGKELLSQLNIDFHEKINGYVKLIKNIECNIDAEAREIKRLQKMKKSNENKIKWLKNELKESMTTAGKDKVKYPLFTVSLQLNNPSVKSVELELLDEKYKIPQPDKIDNLQILRDNKISPVSGVEIERTKSIRIR